jgi:hypothetical protein
MWTTLTNSSVADKNKSEPNRFLITLMQKHNVAVVGYAIPEIMRTSMPWISVKGWA